MDVMTEPQSATAVAQSARVCLNCGTALAGPFCSQCGQRDVPPYPTVRELTHDAWHELSHWDGRYVQTFLTLLGRPGALTLASLEGRRRRYVTPLRVYLTASLFYFLVAASSPNLNIQTSATVPGANVKIDLRHPEAVEQLTPEQQAQLRRSVGRAPWWAQPVMRAVVNDPRGLRQRFLTMWPRVLFALVPVFAAIVALFYRRRPFAQHLIFGLHLHAAMFMAMAIAEASNLLQSRVIAGIAGLSGFVFIISYALAAFRRVYRERWHWIAVKSIGVVALYGLAVITALVSAMFWAAR